MPEPETPNTEHKSEFTGLLPIICALATIGTLVVGWWWPPAWLISLAPILLVATIIRSHKNRLWLAVLAACGSTFFLAQEGSLRVIREKALSNAQAAVLVAIAVGWVIVICYAISLLDAGRDDD